MSRYIVCFLQHQYGVCVLTNGIKMQNYEFYLHGISRKIGGVFIAINDNQALR